MSKQSECAGRKRLKLIAQFGGKCFVKECQVSDPNLLHFAHVKETALKGESRGKWARIRDVELHPDCYALLCGGGIGGHHHAFDMGFIAIEAHGKTYFNGNDPHA